jgi:4-hydroxy-3-methylbut-2-en-1-yl diphosphate synthase IspG/GcpE
MLEIVSCPSCGRAQVDVYTLANQVNAALDGLDLPLRAPYPSHGSWKPSSNTH